MRRLLPTRRRRDRGAVIPMVALSLTVLMTMTAFAVDLGRMRTERRDLQADADALALDAVQMIHGLDAAAALPVAQTEAAASAVRNHVDPTEILSVEVGTWDVPTQQFSAMTSAGQYPDAVRVILTDMVDMFFDFSTDERSVTRTGVAISRGATRGELGSVLAGLEQAVDPTTAPCRVHQQASFMNSIYTSMLGLTSNVVISGDAEVDTGDCEVVTPATGLKLDAVSWRGLGYGRATLDDIAAEMGLGSKDALFDGLVDGRDFLRATARVLQASPDVLDVQAGNTLGQIATIMSNTTDVDLSAIIDPGTGPLGAGGGAATGNGSAADAGIDALTLFTGTVMLINGDNLASASVPLTLPYLSSPVTARIHVIEPPQTHEGLRFAGQQGPSTAQARIAVDVPLQNLNLDLSILGLAGTQLAPGNLRFVVEVGRATSTYERVSCPQGGTTEVDMSVDPDAVSFAYGSATNAQVTGGATIDVSSSVQVNTSVSLLGGLVNLNLSSMTNVEETQGFVGGVATEGLSQAQIDLLGAPSSNTFTAFGSDSPWHRYPGGISGTQLTDLTYAQVQYNALAGSVLSALGVSQLTVENMVRSALDAATDSIVEDIGANIVDPLLHALGITVAGADGRILNVACQMPALANRG